MRDMTMEDSLHRRQWDTHRRITFQITTISLHHLIVDLRLHHGTILRNFRFRNTILPTIQLKTFLHDSLGDPKHIQLRPHHIQMRRTCLAAVVEHRDPLTT
jgi:hypothetical protein